MRGWRLAPGRVTATALLLLSWCLPPAGAVYKRLFAWGYNRYGNLGAGTPTTQVLLMHKPVCAVSAVASFAACICRRVL
jgi:hypothetical protein